MNKEYYRRWLQNLEYEQLELIGEILHIELFLHDSEKIIKKGEMNDMQDEPEFEALRKAEERLKLEHEFRTNRLDEVELDIEHCKFMIKYYNWDKS